MKTTQRAFLSGEIDPALHKRVDLQRYQTALSTCKNFFMKSQGGLYNRPGLRWVGEVKDSTERTRVIPFQFNTEQTYMLEFSPLIMRVIKDGAYVLAGAGPALFELATPYTAADLFDTEENVYLMGFTQTADVMTIASRNHDLMDLGRLADDNWTLVAVDFSSSATAPAVPALATVGAGAGTNNKDYDYVVTSTDTDGVESIASPNVLLNTPSLTTTAGIRITIPVVVGTAFYTIYKDTDGSGIYGFIGETLGTTFDDFNIGPDKTRTPPQENEPISSAGNYPGAVAYYAQRRVFANTDNDPQKFWMTQIGIFDSLRFSTPARDNDAISQQIASRQVNEIRHIISLDDLILMTSGAEYRVTEGQDQVITPSTVGAKPQSYYGSSKARPVEVNDSVIFVQEKGQKVRDLEFSIDVGKYAGNVLSILSEHLFKNRTVVEMAYAEDPYGILWCVMSDGALLGLTYLKEHQVWGWHRHETDGLFESVATIREGDRDAVYFVIKRTIDGADVRYVERLEPRFTDAAENAFFVDSGITYDGAATDTITGLDHLEGETVKVLAAGNVVNNLVVASGQITLPRAATPVHVGLGYNCDMETLGLDDPGTTLQGRKKNVAEVAISVLDSRGGWAGPDFDNLTEIKPRFDSDGYDAIALKTFEERVNVTADWTDEGKLAIRQLDPLPMTILCVTPEFDIGG